ncbi:MAG: aminoglycoside phosphotransferase family protein [Mycobacteriales bacterium]
MSELETPLAGGNVNTVVRVGDTVRREAGPHTPAVHALLRHLRAAGFDGVPEPLGYDDLGREVLSYVEGEVGGYPLPPSWRTDAALAGFARFLRAFHDAQAGFVPPPDAAWTWYGEGVPAGAVVCHQDAAPYNTVRRPDGGYALIDFDLASPADPLMDVAFAAWKWVPLESHAAALGFPPPVDRGRRLRILADAYGLDAGQRTRLLDQIEYRMTSMITGIERLAAEGHPAFVRLLAEGHTEYPRRDLELLATHRAEWQETVTRPLVR